ncbi:hypothetical protein WSI_05710 [Candidatus Liberibacter asiaticus str. gxpsy]|uniref:Lipoprotein n=1 Tax=Candidatus Liberibacter asiaticus str. gxpsy TaxID=1174529 RepID=A0ABM5NH62_LIBAS|nr:hypothetical protein [Candidatus Liberibacter asiaticus]AGH17499.1 hypothetical protein WSI_05710 [Candidatus Liberibacter asiaticus str. gxpsy]
MTIKKVLIASTLLSLCGCSLADEPKKLNPDQLCDAVCRLTLEEQKELQTKVNQRYEEHLTKGAKLSSD